MDYDKFVKRTFVIGRQQKNAPAVRAFDLRRKPDGGLVISNVKEGGMPDDRERHRLFVHFGAPIVARVGDSNEERSWDGAETRQPGDPQHFATAVHRLPPPFILIDSKE